MKLVARIFKWIGISVLTLVLLLTIVVIMRQNLTFEAPYPNVHSSTDSAVIAKGEYLFYGPAHCMDCHSNKAGNPLLADVDVTPSGGYLFDLPVGQMRAPNITSDKKTGIGNMTDGQIARLLRYGVSADGRAVLDFMPFHHTSDEDLTAIISYLRTIPPVEHEVPRMEYNLLGKIVKAFLLKPVGPTEDVPVRVQPSATAEYGEYLANNVANCKGCHTNRDLMTGAFIGADYAGGFKMEASDHSGNFFVTRNLTPDPKTGHIAMWTEEQFVQRFRMGKLMAGSPMPWEPFGKMSDDDLIAIYRYLKTVKPVEADNGPTLITDASELD
jgi:mono/diheme cytochrome c family protein